MSKFSFFLLTCLFCPPLFTFEDLTESPVSGVLVMETHKEQLFLLFSQDEIKTEMFSSEELELVEEEKEKSFLNPQIKDQKISFLEADPLSFEKFIPQKKTLMGSAYFSALFPVVYLSEYRTSQTKNALQLEVPKLKIYPIENKTRETYADSIEYQVEPAHFHSSIEILSSDSPKKKSHPIYYRGPNQELLEIKEHKFLLITGCARSGTTYISEVLKQVGLDIKHEALGKDGSASWPMAATTSDDSPWGPSATGIYFEHIFHQVRHPLLVISSVYTTEPEQSWDFICKEIPEIRPEDDHVVKCAKYWYYWNLMAEGKAEWTYQVEEIEAVLDQMSARLQFPLSKEALDLVSTTTNHRGAYIHQFTWSDLREMLPSSLLSRIQTLALKYGYCIED